jgi:hypothetical protein
MEVKVMTDSTPFCRVQFVSAVPVHMTTSCVVRWLSNDWSLQIRLYHQTALPW